MSDTNTSKKIYHAPQVRDLGCHSEIVQRFLIRGTFDGDVRFAPLVNS